MTTKTFYVKIRGRVLGPFPPKRLMQMASQGQLSRVHQLSTDGNDWHRADKYPELFNKQAEAKASAQTANQQSAPNEVMSAGTADWHYGIDGSSDGPVSKSKIISMIKKQALAGTDLLWHSELSDWQPVEDLPEFAAHLPKSVSIDTGGSSAGNAHSGGKVDLVETARVLKSQTSWVLFIYICLYVAAGCLFLTFLFGVIKGGQQRDSQMISQGIVALMQMGVFIVAAIFLNRFVTYAGRFHHSKRVSDLNQALAWLQRFWILLGIVLIISIFVIVTLLITVFSISGAGL